MKLCAACLLGYHCRYDGKSNLKKASKKLLKEYLNGEIIPVCPEQLGGMPTPRDASEIQGKSGEYVLDNEVKILSKNNKDVSKYFLRGANEVLNQAND